MARVVNDRALRAHLVNELVPYLVEWPAKDILDLLALLEAFILVGKTDGAILRLIPKQS